MARKNRMSGETENSLKARLFDSFELRGLSVNAARAFSSGKAAKMLRYVLRLLAFTPTRVYACASLSFGLLTLVLHLGEYYFKNDALAEPSSLIIGAAFALLSVLLFISDKPLCIALQSSRITDFIFFEFFSMRRMQKNENEKSLPLMSGIFFGFVFAVLGFFVPVYYVALSVGALIFVFVSMTSPEFPYISSILLFPYLNVIPYSSWILASISLLALVSFLRKVAVGKRVYNVEIYDILFFFFILSVLLTGVILGGKASTEPALLIIIFTLGYVPAANIAANRRLCDCIVSAIALSSAPTSVFAVISYAVNWGRGVRRPSSAWFLSSEMLAVYLSVSVLFSIYLAVERKKKTKKISYLVSFLLSLAGLITTEYFALVIALVIGVCMFFVIRSKKTPKLLVLPLLLLPFAVYLLPESVLLWISEFFGISPDLISLRSALLKSASTFFDNIFLGIGANGFGANINTYFGIACRFGILAVVVCLAVFLIRILHVGVYRKYYPNALVGFYVDMTSLAMLIMLVIGSYTDVISEISAAYFFVVIFGLGTAALRISKKERDQMLSYYKDSRSQSASVIDVFLKG